MSNYDDFTKEELIEFLNTAECARLNNFVNTTKTLVQVDCRGIACEECPFYDDYDKICVPEELVKPRLEKLGYLKRE